MEGARTIRRSPAAGLVTCVIAMSLMASPLVEPASAYLEDKGFRQSSTDSNSQSRKSEITSCPSGQSAVGGGAFVDPFSGDLALQKAAPVYQVGDFTTAAAETDFISSSWRLRDQVHCFTATNNSPSFHIVCCGEHYVKSVSLEDRVTDSDTSSTIAEDVDCGPGRRAISGGARVVSSNRNIALQESARGSNSRRWQGRGRKVDQTSVSWRLGVTAVCANVTSESGASDYAHPISVAQDTTSLSTASSRYDFIVCPLPAPANHVIGGGAAVLGSGSTSASRNVALTQSYPSETAPGVGEQRWEAKARATDNTSIPWRLRVWIVCAGSSAGP